MGKSRQNSNPKNSTTEIPENSKKIAPNKNEEGVKKTSKNCDRKKTLEKKDEKGNEKCSSSSSTLHLTDGPLIAKKTKNSRKNIAKINLSCSFY